VTNPKKAAYNRVYNRTSFSVDSLFRMSRRKGSSAAGVLALLLLWPILALIGLCSPAHPERRPPPAAVVSTRPRSTPTPYSPSKATPATTLGVTCKVRSAAAASSEVVGRAPAGQSVEILETGKHWTRIRISGREGWIHDNCIVDAREGRPRRVSSSSQAADSADPFASDRPSARRPASAPKNAPDPVDPFD
jgi:hypothetical protein